MTVSRSQRTQAGEMVIAAVHDGAGNQLFQYAMGRALADRLGVPLKLDVTACKRDSRRPYILHEFAIRAEEATDAEVATLKPHPLRTGRIARKLRFQAPKVGPTWFWETLFYRYDPRVHELHAPVYVDGYWQSAKYFEHIRGDLAKDLHVLRAPDGPEAELVERVRGLESVCLHVRRGDYVGNDLFHCLPANYYSDAARVVLARIPSAAFVVFTDDPAWAESSLELPGTVIRTWSAGPRTTLDDLRLMMACKHFVIPNSTFSWWPAWLGQHPNKLVVCPRRWFVNEDWEAAGLRGSDWIPL